MNRRGIRLRVKRLAKMSAEERQALAKTLSETHATIVRAKGSQAKLKERRQQAQEQTDAE